MISNLETKVVRRSSRSLCLRNSMGYQNFQGMYIVFGSLSGRMCLIDPSLTLWTTWSENSIRSSSSARFLTSQKTVLPHFDVAAITFFVSSSLSNNPSFLIVPTFGAFSLGCAASALLYACCSALVLAA